MRFANLYRQFFTSKKEDLTLNYVQFVHPFEDDKNDSTRYLQKSNKLARDRQKLKPSGAFERTGRF